MRSYLIILLALLILSTGCAKQTFDKVEKTKVINDPVFGEGDGDNDYDVGEDDGDNGPGEDDGPRDWNTEEPDWDDYKGDHKFTLTLMCSNSRTRAVGYNLMSAKALELRLVDESGKVICKNSNTAAIKDQILNNKTLLVPTCSAAKGNKYALTLVDPGYKQSERESGDLLNFHTQRVFVVRKNVNSSWALINRVYQDDPSDEAEVLYNGNEHSSPDLNCDRRASPLVIKTVNEEQKGIELTSQRNGILFDILGENSDPRPHAKKQISWITKASYMFLVKPDSHGKVNGINEMFGDNTKGPDGQFADDGYAALAKFDHNKDKVIDAKDKIYSELKLWGDKNFDGKSQKNELHSLSDAGIVAIDLQYDNRFTETDRYGNQTKMKSVVKLSNGSYRLIFDLWFNYENKLRRF